jgi:hypothetical protein
MKRTMITLGALTVWSIPAIAAGATETEGVSLITILLLGFGAVIVVGQLIPGLVLFFGMMRGMLGHDATKTKPLADLK